MNDERLPCFECVGGRLEPIRQGCVTAMRNAAEVTVPDVPMLRCPECGDTVIGDEGMRWMDAWLAQNHPEMAADRLPRRRISTTMQPDDAG